VDKLKYWPRLPADALKRIDDAERSLNDQVAEDRRARVLGNPLSEKSHDAVFAAGYRAIDYICDRAEALFDASAEEYIHLHSEDEYLGEVLRGGIGPNVARVALGWWAQWLVAVGLADSKSKRFKFRLPETRAGQKLVAEVSIPIPIIPARKQSVFVAVTELQERLNHQIEKAVQARIVRAEDQAKKAAEARAGSNLDPSDPSLRRVRIDRFIEKMVDHEPILRKDISTVAGYATETDRLRYERN
jgi:hypothetical protein